MDATQGHGAVANPLAGDTTPTDSSGTPKRGGLKRNPSENSAPRTPGGGVRFADAGVERGNPAVGSKLSKPVQQPGSPLKGTPVNPPIARDDSADVSVHSEEEEEGVEEEESDDGEEGSQGGLLDSEEEDDLSVETPRPAVIPLKHMLGDYRLYRDTLPGRALVGMGVDLSPHGDIQRATWNIFVPNEDTGKHVDALLRTLGRTIMYSVPLNVLLLVLEITRSHNATPAPGIVSLAIVAAIALAVVLGTKAHWRLAAQAAVGLSAGLVAGALISVIVEGSTGRMRGLHWFIVATHIVRIFIDCYMGVRLYERSVAVARDLKFFLMYRVAKARYEDTALLKMLAADEEAPEASKNTDNDDSIYQIRKVTFGMGAANSPPPAPAAIPTPPRAGNSNNALAALQANTDTSGSRGPPRLKGSDSRSPQARGLALANQPGGKERMAALSARSNDMGGDDPNDWLGSMGGMGEAYAEMDAAAKRIDANPDMGGGWDEEAALAAADAGALQLTEAEKAIEEQAVAAALGEQARSPHSAEREVDDAIDKALQHQRR